MIGQVAGSVLLMVLTTQLFRGASYMLSHNPGFQVKNGLLTSFDPANMGYSREQTAAFYKELLAGVRALPGVKKCGDGALRSNEHEL